MSSASVTLGSAATRLDQSFALDVQGLEGLRRSARSAPDEALKQVSRQFEAMFMGMLLKSMRDATPSSGLLDSEGGKMYQSLLDGQLAQNLSGRGMKLAEQMFAQLRRGLAQPPTTAAAFRQTALVTDAAASAVPPAAPQQPTLVASPRPGMLASALPALPAAIHTPQAAPMPLPPLAVADVAPAQSAGDDGQSAGLQARVSGFIAKLGSSAKAAAEAAGIPAALVLAQAALESAWGKHEVRGSDGAQSFNVFGIKADSSWRGRVAQAPTTEIVNGVAQRVNARFRAYGSYQEALADYAKFLTGNPRYAGVLSTSDPAHAAHALQRAGYATDPDYARKLVRVMKQFL